MEMCYEGTLVMPSNYSDLDEEEMMYVDGGGITCSKLANRINIAVSALLLVAGIGSGAASVAWFTKNSVKGLVVASLKGAIKSTLAAFGFSAFSGIYGLLSTVNGKWTIGYGVAWLIDNKLESGSKKGNGICFG